MLYCKNLWLSLNQSRFISFLVITLNMQNTHPGRSISFCRCRSLVFRPIFTTGILLFFLLMKRNSASISLFLFVSEAAHNGEWINSVQSLGVIVRHINAGPDLHFSKTLALHSVISINPFAQKKCFWFHSLSFSFEKHNFVANWRLLLQDLSLVHVHSASCLWAGTTISTFQLEPTSGCACSAPANSRWRKSSVWFLKRVWLIPRGSNARL